MSARTVALESLEHSQHAVFLRFRYEDLRFSTSYWYQDLDLHELAAVHSPEAVERLLFHLALFELNKLCSLRPTHVALGAYRRFLTAELLALWQTVFAQVWAQWRYENDDPDYGGPLFLGGPVDPAPGDAAPLRPRAAAAAEALAFCGGGKDSLVMLRLLQRAGISHDSLAYSSSIYGPAAPQHRLLDGLLGRVSPGRRLRQWVYDDFLDSPVLLLHPALPRTLTAAETPSSIFAALPLALQHGYPGICLGHERSADGGQRRFARTGELVNHQWGKSRQAEALLDGYIRRHLIVDLTCWSALRPVHDVVIFSLLRAFPDDVPFMHSCNVRKPWCLRCPKCLYVWLGCAAFLPRALLRATFGEDDLLADPGRAADFAALMAELDQPFECIGHAEEARIFLAACAARGHQGPAVARLRAEGGPAAVLPSLDRYLDVDLDALPAPVRERLGPQLTEAAQRAGLYLRGLLGGDPAGGENELGGDRVPGGGRVPGGDRAAGQGAG